MSNQDQPTATETETENMRATRRTVIRGAGVAGLLTMGVGTASAQRGRQAQQQAAARGRGPTLPPQAAQKAKDIIDIKFPGKDDGGNGGDDGSGGIDG
ncbi:hypothetical protein [Natronorubrum sp. A-ect3]|uniref:hypothetical protein n=1 Tax=Natronorubrum sp. A-ect3 TaxID=3242698 RepID=UPI00359D926C